MSAARAPARAGRERAAHPNRRSIDSDTPCSATRATARGRAPPTPHLSGFHQAEPRRRAARRGGGGGPPPPPRGRGGGGPPPPGGGGGGGGGPLAGSPCRGVPPPQ